MSDSKRQSIIMTGIGLILLSCLMMYFALSQPKISDESVIVNGTQSTEYSQTVSADTSSTATVETETVAETKSQEVVVAETQTAEQTSTAVSGKINLNTCTAAELTSLKGIGEVKAEAIIQYREYLGGYTSVEQIKDIKGIGDKIYANISPYLTV